MRKSIATVSLSGTLSQKLEAAAAAGFDGVEIFENDLLAVALSPEAVRARAADLGLAVEMFQPFRDFETDDPARFAANLRRAERKFELMTRLGADLLLVCSSVDPTAPAEDARTAEQLRLLGERAARHGVRIAYEALAWGHRVSTYDHAWRIVEEADHPALGTCLDSFHILSRDGDPAGIKRIPGEKIFFLQLADAPQTAMDVLQWSRHYRCFPGQGGFDVAAVVAAAVDAGYTGPLSLEVFNDVFRQADPARTAVDALRSLLVLEESAGLTAAPRQPSRPVAPSGFAFAEIAAADPEPLRELLTALGFARAGRHRGGKPVELWQQGQARLLLNSSSPAAGGGPALAALGLESPAPDAAVRRAEWLLAPVLPRRRGPEDVPLDAVAAPDGTELFFCATGRPGLPDWRRDFIEEPSDAQADEPSDAPSVQPSGAAESAGEPLVTGIDHAALTQPWHRFDEASLFYPAVLGLRPEESLDLADPYGLFRSRAVADPSGGLRIALNVAPGPGHEDGRPQHIALAVADLDAALRRLRALGIATLSVPDNYYEDLDARLALPQAELSALRELGVLYDRDDHGDFRHCYTATYGRVFFELVERRGGYRGYGAANAHVRLAAQHARQSNGSGRARS